MSFSVRRIMADIFGWRSEPEPEPQRIAYPLHQTPRITEPEQTATQRKTGDVVRQWHAAYTATATGPIRQLPAPVQQTGAIFPVIAQPATPIPQTPVQHTGAIGIVFVTPVEPDLALIKSGPGEPIPGEDWLFAPVPGDGDPLIVTDVSKLPTQGKLSPSMLTGLLPIPEPDEEEVSEDKIPTAKLVELDTMTRVDPGLYRMRQLAKMANRREEA
jgi:hypothetical protein